MKWREEKNKRTYTHAEIHRAVYDETKIIELLISYTEYCWLDFSLHLCFYEAKWRQILLVVLSIVTFDNNYVSFLFRMHGTGSRLDTSCVEKWPVSVRP